MEKDGKVTGIRGESWALIDLWGAFHTGMTSSKAAVRIFTFVESFPFPVLIEKREHSSKRSMKLRGASDRLF